MAIVSLNLTTAAPEAVNESRDMRNTVSVTECKHPRYTHRVRFTGPNGKRADRYFTNETDAMNFAKDQRKETGATGTAFGSMTEGERAALAFWRAFVQDTSPKPPAPLTVMKDFKTSWLASKASVTITDAVAKFTTHHEADGSSPRHVASLKSRLGRFEKDKGDCLVSSITTGIFTEWLNGLRATRADKEGEKLTTVTRHNLTRTLRSFFVFAMERGWTLSNPVPAQKRSKSKAAKLATQTAPAIMLPADLARFMAALKTEAPAHVPFWALKFFAGIRDAEAARMDWSMIDLAGGKIHLPAEHSKTGESRSVKIEPNLAAWLKPCAKESGKIVPGDSTRKRAFKKAVASLATKDAKGNVTKTLGGIIGEWRAARERRVLIIDGEMNLPASQERLQLLKCNLERLHLLHHEVIFNATDGKVSLNLADPKQQQDVCALIKNMGVQVVVIDNLSCLFRGVAENEADAWEAVLPWLLDLRRTGISVVVVAHAGRNGQMRGTSRREDSAHWVLSLEPAHDDSGDFNGTRFVSRFTKNRNSVGSESPPTLWEFQSGPDGMAVTARPQTDLAVMLDLIRGGMDSASDLAKELDRSKGCVSKWAKRLHADGKITIIQGGKYKPV